MKNLLIVLFSIAMVVRYGLVLAQEQVDAVSSYLLI